jgi:hypothetical protein
LQTELKGRSKRIVMVAFDLLYLDGYDLRKVPLFERKALLKKIIAKTDIQFSERVSRSMVARCTRPPARLALRASSRRSATASTSRVASTIG